MREIGPSEAALRGFVADQGGDKLCALLRGDKDYAIFVVGWKADTWAYAHTRSIFSDSLAFFPRSAAILFRNLGKLD